MSYKYRSPPLSEQRMNVPLYISYFLHPFASASYLQCFNMPFTLTFLPQSWAPPQHSKHWRSLQHHHRSAPLQHSTSCSLGLQPPCASCLAALIFWSDHRCTTIPWAQLQHYHEHTGVYSNVSVPARPEFPSLMQMVELETCSLICNFRIAAGMQGTFRHLQHLKLTGDNGMIILEALVLPALLSLHINSTVPFLEDISRILPSYPTVRALCIRRFVSDATNWQSYKAVLEGSPALTVFVLQTRHCEQRDFMSFLIQTPNIGVALTTLKVKVQKQPPAFGMSEDVAQSQREDACRSLRAVRLTLNVEYNTDDSPIHLPDLL
ncbi:hypothetical protein C8J56DRAFT_1065183 [Mycena floridula]|nr:hypothetical protein C8J56DRAFT_1065183 [Mycena floridula]